MIADWIGLLVLAAWLGACGVAVWMTVTGVDAIRSAGRAARAATPITLQVAERHDHGRFVRLLLAPPAGRRARLPRYEAGDYLTVIAAPDGGRAHRRCYSLAGWHPRPRRYELLIKREEEGIVSRLVHDTLRVGSCIEALTPRGVFHLTEDRGERLLVAAGVGITPLRSMLHRMLADRDPPPTTLFWSVRHEAELAAYHAEFSALAADREWFRYVPSVTRPGPDWRGATLRLDAGLVLADRRGAPLAGVWICASAELTRDLSEALAGRGVPAGRIHFELFGAGGTQVDETAVVTLEPCGRSLSYLGEPTLLQCLERQGVAVDSECRAGHCGACRMRLLSGEVATVLPPQMAVPEAQILACCVRPAGDIVVALLDG